MGGETTLALAELISSALDTEGASKCLLNFNMNSIKQLNSTINRKLGTFM
jgi:hypothetical protein